MDQNRCCAEPVLTISGPTEVFEQSSVTFIITSEGKPVHARVVFGDGLHIQYSNSTTGEVTFRTPAVEKTDTWYVITASIFGSGYASHSLLVRNRTNALDIHLSTDSPYELETFTVTVTNQGNPISDAYVWFNNDIVTTDIYGQVVLTAPDVLVTTSQGLYVNKTGFTPQTCMVTVQNAQRGLKFMHIIIPHLVEPEQTNIPVHVIGLNGGIHQAEVNVSYEGMLLTTQYTDASGYVFIAAPSKNYDTSFCVSVRKQGYQTLTGTQTINITLFERTLAHDLTMLIFPSEVFEGEAFTIKITDECAVGVSGVSIWRDSYLLDSKTDTQGMLIMVAPPVFIDQEIYLYGILQGYNYAQGKITIRNRISYEQHLYIRVQLTINESSTFPVTILDSTSRPVQDALVTFNLEERKSDSKGTVYFTAPSIQKNVRYTIHAEKTGYIPASFTVTIIPATETADDSARTLFLFVVPAVFESEQFTVVVKDAFGIPVSSVYIRFQDTDFMTDAFGTVVLPAPSVDSDEMKTIIARKTGYTSAQETILIKNTSQFPYWFIVVVVLIISAVGIAVYVRFNRFL